MDRQSPAPEKELYRQIPKVELHRHLEGSVRLETLIELARKFEITLPVRPELPALVQMQPDEELTFTNFLAKFQVLRQFYRTPEIISRITREVIEDAAADNINHLELLFTPFALSRVRGFAMAEVMDWVVKSAEEASQDCKISTSLFASVNRHEDPALAEEVAGLAVERKGRGIVGFNLAGNEAEFSAEPFYDIFRQAKASGLVLTVHAGEWAGADNVREAIEKLQAVRIGHGVRILENPAVVDMAREAGTVFEVCLSSNYQTGSIPSIKDHPLARMANAGLKVTLNTDDPSIFQITLSDEYRLAMDTLGLSRPVLNQSILAAAEAAVLPQAEKQKLVSDIRQGLKN